MATDMPTTPSTQLAKFYYGKMIGVAILLCWVHNVQFETLSYSILILNIFTYLLVRNSLLIMTIYNISIRIR